MTDICLNLGASEVRIETAWVGSSDPKAPAIVFLHEGLGSVALWRDFPQRLCVALGCRGLVYSRPGYGGSSPRAPGEHWGPDFMHRQAYDVLPALLSRMGLGAAGERPVLFGHSDGASIALLFAARHPHAVRGTVALAPHVFVEPVTRSSIEAAARAFREGPLRERLARYHADVDSAFWGWCDAWLNPRFMDWNIEAELSGIRCPVLLVQGLQDEYGTLAQLRRIEARVPHAQRRELASCGHSPHRDQPEAVVEAVRAFMAGLGA